MSETEMQIQVPEPFDPFQSQKMIKRILTAARLIPNMRRGQAFLVDRNLLEKLVASAQLDETDLVLEVGTGTGGLTAYLAPAAGHVITVEIDEKLGRAAKRVLGENAKITMLSCDALAGKHDINPEVVGKIMEMWGTGKFARFKLIANLPYAVASPLIADLLDLSWPGPPLERMCFTVQEEVADRLTASPKSRDYGWLTVLVKSLADIEVISPVPASCFYPRPKVASTIMRMFPKKDRPTREKMDKVADMVQYPFQHRRKMILGNLKRYKEERGGEWSPEGALAECGIPGTVRPEEVEVGKFWELSERIKS